MDLLYRRKIEWLERPRNRYHTVVGILYRVLLTSGFLLALFTLIVQFGFDLPESQWEFLEGIETYIVLLFLLIVMVEILLTGSFRKGLQSHLIELILLILILVQYILLEMEIYDPTWTTVHTVFFLQIYFITMQIYLFVALLIRALRAGRYLFLVGMPPAATFSLTFLILIVLGTLALWLPRATYGTTAPRIDFIDALFTSASAVCVTGLITVDTATVFSRLGQSIILVLIQMGGLGIMSLVGFYSISMTRGGTLKSRVILQDVLGTDALSRVSSLLQVIILSTFLCEAIGFLLILPGFLSHTNNIPTALFHALFHSVSAFCNAGFSTFSRSMEPFAESAVVLIPLTLLIILGGIGFPVIYELSVAFQEIVTRGRMITPISVHTKLTLRWTGLLLIIGILGVSLGGNWEGCSWKKIILSSLFQGVIPRSAGFTSIPLLQIAPWCLVLFMVLMYIGAAPGGTTGGIKVTSLGMLYHGAITLFKGRKHIEIMNRAIPDRILHSAFVILGLSGLYIAVTIMALVWAEPDQPFFDLVFEVFSAFGTGGLSLGLTPKLSVTGKLIIILTMYIGRVGPITLFLAMFRRKNDALYSYPTGSILIG